MLCQYQLSDGLCNAPIIPDKKSYSGWSHQQRADWQHWASPIAYGLGQKETDRIFTLCIYCGKNGPENKAHVLKRIAGGHRFQANK